MQREARVSFNILAGKKGNKDLHLLCFMSISFIFTFVDQRKLVPVQFLAFEVSEIRDL